MSSAAQQPFRHFALLDALQHAVIATDTRGRITGWSASAEILYGWTSDDVIGRDILEVTPSDLSRAQAAAIMATLRSGDVWSGDFSVRRRNGDEFLASVTDVPMLDDSEHLTGIVGLSAPAGTRTPFSEIARRFVDACNRVWPGAVSFELEVSDDATLTASDPHLIQLMALLMIRQAPAMNGGSRAQITVRTANSADFAEFGRIPRENAVDICFAWSDHEMLQSPLDRFVSTATPTPYIPKLVGMTGGVLLRGFDQTHWRMMHVILPTLQSDITSARTRRTAS
jgi:PAS domain S-box-containing protein